MYNEGDGKCSYGRHLLNPSNGDQYIVELWAINQAGGISHWESQAIVADLTPPIAEATLEPGSADSRDNVLQDGDTGFIGADGRGLVYTPRCSDAESAIHIVHVQVTTFFTDGEPLRSDLVLPRSTPNLVPTYLNFARPPRIGGIDQRLFVRTTCYNVAGLVGRSDILLTIADHPACDDWKLRIQSSSLQGSWSQSSDRRLTLQTVRWRLPAIDPKPPGIARVRYELADTNGTIIPLDAATHEGPPPELLSLYALRLVHAHTYYLIVTPQNLVGIEVSCPCFQHASALHMEPALYKTVV